MVFELASRIRAIRKVVGLCSQAGTSPSIPRSPSRGTREPLGRAAAIATTVAKAPVPVWLIPCLAPPTLPRRCSPRERCCSGEELSGRHPSPAESMLLASGRENSLLNEIDVAPHNAIVCRAPAKRWLAPMPQRISSIPWWGYRSNFVDVWREPNSGLSTECTGIFSPRSSHGMRSSPRTTS